MNRPKFYVILIVKALFRWGKKRLHYFVANLFRMLRNKFYQNRLSFIEDMTQILAYFFLDTLYTMVTIPVSACCILHD